MCTLTYIPKPDGSYLLTSNRDETPLRAATGLERQRIGEREILFPKDAGAGGTWLALSSSGQAVCLINGAYKRHRRKPPYRRSRGLMVLDFFEYDETPEFIDDYPFLGMEPFTMVVRDQDQLWDLRWNGQKLHVHTKDPRQYAIWASPVLYDLTYRKKRQHWLADWLEQRPQPTRGSMLHFHLKAGEGDPHNDLVMNRHNLVRTVSIASVVNDGNRFDLSYLDLLKHKDCTAELGISGKPAGPRPTA